MYIFFLFVLQGVQSYYRPQIKLGGSTTLSNDQEKNIDNVVVIAIVKNMKLKISRNLLDLNHILALIPLNDNSNFTSKVINDHRFLDLDSSN